jgi:hypothetical protein
MGDEFLSLFTEGARRRARESTSLKRRPTSITQHQPKEESALGGSPGLPNLQGACYGHTPMEHAKVTRLHGVGLFDTPVPLEDISNIHGDH